MKATFLLIALLAVCAASGAAQETRRNQSEPVQEFASPAQEIKFYLTEANYYKSDGCVIYPDENQIERLRGLASGNRDLFLETAFNELKNAPADKIQRLIPALVYAGSENNRLLTDLLTPQNMKTVFAKNGSAILEQLNNQLEYNYDYAGRLYVIEALVALKERPAAAKILRMLNEDRNPYLEKMMTALVNSGATEELVDFLQLKILEDLCDKNRYSVTSGTPVKNLLDAVEALSKQSDRSVYVNFERIRGRLILEPDEASLIRFANQGIHERIRGTAILLLAVSKSEAGLKVILEHLKNDSSKLVRFWAAQSFQTHQNPKEEVFDALVEAYKTDAEPEVRSASIAAFAQMDGERAEPTVKEALNDKNQMVREIAQRILDFIEKYRRQ